MRYVGQEFASPLFWIPDEIEYPLGDQLELPMDHIMINFVWNTSSAGGGSPGGASSSYSSTSSSRSSPAGRQAAFGQHGFWAIPHDPEMASRGYTRPLPLIRFN